MTSGLVQILPPASEGTGTPSQRRVVVDREGMVAPFLRDLQAQGYTVITLLRTDQYEGLESFFAILSADYLSVPEEQIGTIESVLMVTGGDVVYSAPPFTAFAPEQLPSVHPEWSPVAVFGGYQRADEA